MDRIQPGAVKALMVKFFSEKLGVEDALANDGNVLIEDLAVGSLAIVDMLWEVEEQLGVRIENLTDLKGKTIDELANYICSLQPAPTVS